MASGVCGREGGNPHGTELLKQPEYSISLDPLSIFGILSPARKA